SSKVEDVTSVPQECDATSAVQTSAMDPVLPENEVRDTSIEGKESFSEYEANFRGTAVIDQQNSSGNSREAERRLSDGSVLRRKPSRRLSSIAIAREKKRHLELQFHEKSTGNASTVTDTSQAQVCGTGGGGMSINKIAGAAQTVESGVLFSTLEVQSVSEDRQVSLAINVSGNHSVGTEKYTKQALIAETTEEQDYDCEESNDCRIDSYKEDSEVKGQVWQGDEPLNKTDREFESIIDREDENLGVDIYGDNYHSTLLSTFHSSDGDGEHDKTSETSSKSEDEENFLSPQHVDGDYTCKSTAAHVSSTERQHASSDKTMETSLREEDREPQLPERNDSSISGALKKEECRAELERLRAMLARKDDVDEVMLCLLELEDVKNNDFQLSDEEEYELELLQRHQEGNDLSDDEIDDMEYFIERRLMYNELEIKLQETRSKRDAGEEVDKDLLFEMELFERAREREQLNEMEKLAIEFLERNHMGEELTDDDMDDYLDVMEVLRNNPPKDSDKTEVCSALLSEDDSKYLAILRVAEQDGKELDKSELFELSVLERQERGGAVETIELDEFMQLKRRRQHGDDLRTLQTLRNGREEYDVDRLYELELDERNRKGLPLNDDELYELQLFEKRRNGDKLDEEELEDLELMRKQRANDDKDRQQLQEDKQNGLDINDDLLWELDLLYRNRTGVALSEDETTELEIISRKRNGEQLTDSDIEELELLKTIREENALDKKELMDLRERKANGELVDENLLYELELFQRMRQGDSLNEDELFELSCFESRRAGEDLDDADLDELDRLKKDRLLTHDGYKEESQDDDDSVYMHQLLEKVKKGTRLAQVESHELALIQRKRRGETLDVLELEEIVKLRSKRQEARAESVKASESTRGSIGDVSKGDKKLRKGTKADREKKVRKGTEAHQEKPKPVVRQSSTPTTQNDKPDKKPLQNPSMASAQPMSPPPPSAVPSTQGFLGGIFGIRKKKEDELESQRRQQEELIRQQLEAMNLQEELKELEEKQTAQEELVRNTIELKRKDINKADGSPTSVEELTPQIDLPELSEEEDSESQDCSTYEDDDIEVEDAEVTTQEFSFVKKRAKKVKSITTASEKRTDDESKKSSLSTGSNIQENEETELSRESFEKHLSSTLSVHLTAHGHNADSINRFDDELSVGLSQDIEEVNESKSDNVEFSRESDKSHPWKASSEDRDSLRINRNRRVTEIDEEEKMIEDGLVDEVFDKSLFNFETQYDTGVFRDQEEQDSTEEEKEEEKHDEESNNKEMQNEDERVEEEKDDSVSLSHEQAQPEENGSVTKSDGSSHSEQDNSLHEMDFSARSSNIRDLNMMESISMLHFTDLTGYQYEGIESKLGEKKSGDAKFYETWANEKADKAAVAQFNQMRYARERAELKKQEAKMEAVPRLFLFEGERIRNKKKRRHLPKNRKKRKKLESKLSREFRKAMESIFESESEEEYDVDLKDGGNEREVMMKMSRRLSNDSIVFDDLSESSHASEGPEFDDVEPNPEDDFLDALRQQSMQNDTTSSTVNGSKANSGSAFKNSGDEISLISEHSNLEKIPEGTESVSTNGSRRQQSIASRKTSHTGKSSKSVEVDPAIVYAHEVEKMTQRKNNSIADFRKEMEDLIKRRTGLETPDIDSLIAPNDFTIQQRSMVMDRQKSRKISNQRSQRSGRFAMATGRAPNKQSSFESLLMRKDPIQEDISFDAFNTIETQSNDAHVALVGPTPAAPGTASSGTAFPDPLPVPPTQTGEAIEQVKDKKRKKKGINLKESGAKLKKLAGKAGKAIPTSKFSVFPAFGRKNTHQNIEDDGSFGQGLLG
ncbi:unnamed protein product, partial [Cylindrotheca closterium]